MKWNNNFTKDYENIIIDDFYIDDISFVKSKKQLKILDKLSEFETLKSNLKGKNNTKIINHPMK